MPFVADTCRKLLRFVTTYHSYTQEVRTDKQRAELHWIGLAERIEAGSKLVDKVDSSLRIELQALRLD